MSSSSKMKCSFEHACTHWSQRWNFVGSTTTATQFALPPSVICQSWRVTWPNWHVKSSKSLCTFQWLLWCIRSATWWETYKKSVLRAQTAESVRTRTIHNRENTENEAWCRWQNCLLCQLGRLPIIVRLLCWRTARCHLKVDVNGLVHKFWQCVWLSPLRQCHCHATEPVTVQWQQGSAVDTRRCRFWLPDSKYTSEV